MALSTTISTSPSCRILTVSNSITTARRFVQRLVSFATHNDKEIADELNTILWTISNKYYTADVHFELISMGEWSARHAEGVPAVIFVWKQGELYKEDIGRLAKDLNSFDPDVSLAIKMESQDTVDDEGDGLEDFASTLGFEYIDGNNQRDRKSLEEDTDSGTPGLARVVDALSTIMWPSMIQNSSSTNRKSKAHELLDWARAEEAEDGLRALIDIDEEALSNRKSRMQKEMDEFQRWLEEDEDQRAHQDPWAQRDELGTPFRDSQSTPTTSRFNIEEQRSGFEDDFNEFVGAPTTHDSILEPKSLVQMHTGASYMSLSSDFDEDVWASSNEPFARDESLPSQAEIEATSRRIFGSSISQSSSASPSSNENSFDQLDDDDEFQFSAFDLSRVFDALQVMKGEISGIEDDEERRKAAARVALGLVYSLQADQGPETDSEVVT